MVVLTCFHRRTQIPFASGLFGFAGARGESDEDSIQRGEPRAVEASRAQRDRPPPDEPGERAPLLPGRERPLRNGVDFPDVELDVDPVLVRGHVMADRIPS